MCYEMCTVAVHFGDLKNASNVNIAQCNCAKVILQSLRVGVVCRCVAERFQSAAHRGALRQRERRTAADSTRRRRQSTQRQGPADNNSVLSMI